jgi:predicted NACHT family NTPase
MITKATIEQIDAARKAYDDASWALYDAAVWNRPRLAAKREQLRRALLAIEPGHFSRVERESFDESVRKLGLSSEDTDRRISEYKPSKVARDLDRA